MKTAGAARECEMKGRWEPKYGGGVFRGLGRGWRAKVSVEACARCFGSGECDSCSHTGSVFVLRADGSYLCAAKWKAGT